MSFKFAEDDRGTSLVEVLVALLVLSLLGGMLWGSFRFFTRAGAHEVERLDVRRELAVAMKKLRKVVTEANPLISFDAATGVLNPVLRPPLRIAGGRSLSFRVFPVEQRIPPPAPRLEDLGAVRSETVEIRCEGSELVVIRSGDGEGSREVLARGLLRFAVEALNPGESGAESGLIRLSLAIGRKERPPVEAEEMISLKVPAESLP